MNIMKFMILLRVIKQTKSWFVKNLNCTNSGVYFHRCLRKEREGQMIVLMGVTLAFTVLVMGSLAAEISDIDAAIPQARSNAFLSEIIHIKEIFGTALNYEFADISIVDVDGNPGTTDDNKLVYGGSMYSSLNLQFPIERSVDDISESIRNYELINGRLFKASCKSIKYSHYIPEQGYVYLITVYMELKDSETAFEGDVTYSIICTEIP